MNRVGKVYLAVLVGYCLINILTSCAPAVQTCPTGYEALVIKDVPSCVKAVGRT